VLEITDHARPGLLQAAGPAAKWVWVTATAQSSACYHFVNHEKRDLRVNALEQLDINQLQVARSDHHQDRMTACHARD
jgi:hypothetical protein